MKQCNLGGYNNFESRQWLNVPKIAVRACVNQKNFFSLNTTSRINKRKAVFNLKRLKVIIYVLIWVHR